MEKDSACFIRNAKQVAYHLNLLVNSKCLLSAHFGANNDAFITSILELDNKKSLLVLDCGPKEYLNKHLLESNTVEFHSEYEGIKVAFTADKIKRIRYNDQNALVITIPDSLFWQQRRQFYRIKVPISHDTYCEIRLPENDKPVKFKLHNISISGFCFINDQMELSEALVPTNEFCDCTLYLNGAESETVSVIIKNKSTINPAKARKGQRIGCFFSKITVAGESRIQRYMQNVERESKSLV